MMEIGMNSRDFREFHVCVLNDDTHGGGKVNQLPVALE